MFPLFSELVGFLSKLKTHFLALVNSPLSGAYSGICPRGGLVFFSLQGVGLSIRWSLKTL